MFKKLRNKLILINVSITSIVIVVAFSAIYVFLTNLANNRPPIEDGKIIEVYSDDFERVLNISIQNEKKAAANDLLVILIISGVLIEAIVLFVSYYLAEESIKPIREAYDAQKVFIANASHEIKTPLAGIQANLEAADIKGNKWISNVEKEAEKLSKLNSELLALARTDLIEKSVLDEVYIDKIVKENLKSFESRLKDTKFKVKISAHGKIKIASADFLQILGILMDNAIKYSDSKIDLTLTNHELVISNDGVVVSDKDLDRIFERFYQSDKSSEGVGLGLSIAKTIAMRNGWDLTASNDNKMTSFTLKF